MSRFTVKRSYRQLMVERKAIEAQIKNIKRLLILGPPFEMSFKGTNEWQQRLERDLQSDQALLAEIEKDIERARLAIDASKG